MTNLTTYSSAEKKLWYLNTFLEKLSPEEKIQYKQMLSQLFTQLTQQNNYQSCLDYFKQWLKTNTKFRDLIQRSLDSYISSNFLLDQRIPQKHWDNNNFLDNVYDLSALIANISD
jgi:hypothetical protein